MIARKSKKSATSPATEARAAVEELRALRVRLLDQRDQIASRPVPLALAQAAISDGLARMAEQSLATINLASLCRPADGRSPRLPSLSSDQLLALILASNTGAVADVMKALLAETYGDDPGLDPGERDAELARLDRQILDAEMAEEALVRDCEAAGMAVLRRADASPEATLASDAVLAR